jgi:hypothetical protein
MSWPAPRSTQPPDDWFISGILYATVFLQKSGLQFRVEIVKCYIWSTALYGAETWILRNVYQKYVESFEMWWWTRKENIIWMYRVHNAVLRRVKEEMNIPHAIKWRTGHILSSNCCIKHVIEGQVGQVEGTRRWERIRKQLLDDLKTRRHWELKEDATVCTVWRSGFARGYGPVVRQTP